MAKVVITGSKLKKPTRSKNNILTLYSPKNTCIKTADTLTIDTALILYLPKDSTAHLITKFQGQKMKTIVGPKTERLWLTLLNESYFDKYKIKRRDIIGYLIIEPEDLKIQYKKNPPNQTRRHPDNYLPKDWSKNWKEYWQKKKDVSASNRRVFKSLSFCIRWQRYCKSGEKNSAWNYQ